MSALVRSRTIEASVVIDASPRAVWTVLADFPRHGEWNPFIEAIEGTPREGARLRVTMRPEPDGRPLRFSPRLLRVRPPHELRWRGRLGVRGLLDGEHAFVLRPMPGGRTRLIQSERFSGLLVPFMGGTIEATAAAFEAMNEALRERVEGRGLLPLRRAA